MGVCKRPWVSNSDDVVLLNVVECQAKHNQEDAKEENNGSSAQGMLGEGSPQDDHLENRGEQTWGHDDDAYGSLRGRVEVFTKWVALHEES